MDKSKYVAKVTPCDDDRGGFLGEVVDTKTGKSAGLSSRTPTALRAADDAVLFADRLNKTDGQ